MKNNMEIDDPPRPPMRAVLEEAAGHTLPPTPFDDCVWAAPMPADEAKRQAVVADLDLLESRRPACLSPNPDSESADTFPDLVNSEALQRMVDRCCKDFDGSVSFICVLDDDQQLYLATAGLPRELTSLPRDATFCRQARWPPFGFRPSF